MIQMIPDIVSPSIKSNAEKKLFKQFKEYETDKKIIILHSLGIAEHTNHIFGEIDFVAICNEGFLCMEVKGGLVSRHDGIWSFTNKYGNTTQKQEGPFEQAQGNMQSLRNYMRDRFGANHKFSRAQYACCVIMPDCVCTPNTQGSDYIDSILFDQRKSWNLDTIIKQSFEYWKNQMIEKHNCSIKGLDDSSLGEAANALRGDFQFVPLLSSEINETYQKLTALTKAQYKALMSTSRNPRHMIEGKAGTGKTLIAIEQCKRSYHEGKKVLYLCYNKNIANYVDSQFKSEKLDITATTMHSLLAKLCGHKSHGKHTSDYFEHDLPLCFLAEDVITNKYDQIVIDEGQDLLKPSYLKCIDKLLHKGIDKGNWAIYYDPNQNIYSVYSKPTIDYLNDISTIFTLEQNCRNTTEIIQLNKFISNIPQAPLADTIHGAACQQISYTSKADEYKQITELILKLKNEKVKSEDIVILSPYTKNNPNCFLYEKPLPDSVGKVSYDTMSWYKQSGVIRFSPIASFKGLEAKIIILADIECFSDNAHKLLNYVAISRAQTMLYMFYDQDKENERQQMILNRINID